VVTVGLCIKLVPKLITGDQVALLAPKTAIDTELPMQIDDVPTTAAVTENVQLSSNFTRKASSDPPDAVW
jgi:hypothetical protein